MTDGGDTSGGASGNGDPRWQIVSDLLNAVLEQRPSARDTFLDRACRGDHALRRRVDALLDAHRRAGAGFLAQPAFSLRPTTDGGGTHEGSVVDSPPPRQVGPYRLRQRLGQGGMGAVYRAERTTGGFDQQVAVKVLRPGLDTEQVLARFEAERRILAALDHPNIARLLDGGSTPAGQPYLVMELVDGQRIDAFCASRRLDIKARVALLEIVCGAVHHAHQSLVVHRDLKPANILVTTEGVPKLLDFGVAKLLDDDAERLITRTATPAPLTPQYASPEQLKRRAITTATDVYALGLLAYELLGGRRAYDTSRVSLAEAERLICEVMPTRPSAAPRDAKAIEGLGLPPGERRRLDRSLRGDLDTIVLRALAKEPKRRYGSAEQLAEDLRRYRQGYPILARRDTPWYRFRKLVQRRPWSVAGAGAVATILLGLLVGLMVQRGEILRQRDALARQVETTLEERNRAQAVTGFVIGFLRVPDPSRGQGGDVTVREALDEAAEALETDLAKNRPLQADMLDTIGRVYGNLGLYPEASGYLERSLAIRRAVLGTADPRIGESLANLGHLRRHQGRYAEAEALYRDAIARLRRSYPEGHMDLARILNNLASLLRRVGKAAKAEGWAREALAMQERLPPGPDGLEMSRTLNTLGTLARGRGERDLAAMYYRRALAIHRRHPGREPLGLASKTNNLAQLLVDQGAFDEAIELHRVSFDLRRGVYANDHEDLITSLNNWGLALALAGDGEGALRRSDEAVAMSGRLPDFSTRSRAVVRKNRLLALEASARFDECVAAADALLDEPVVERAPTLRAEIMSVGAACRAASGDCLTATPMLQQSYEVLRAAKGEEAWQVRLARARIERHCPTAPIDRENEAAATTES